MTVRAFALALACAVAAAACSSGNRYERQARDVTAAIVANDPAPVAGEIVPGAGITRVRVAQWSDQFSTQGRLISVKQVADGCPSGAYCFDVAFEKGSYRETMRLTGDGRIAFWNLEGVPRAGDAR